MKLYINWMLHQLLLHGEFWSVLFLSAATPVTRKFLISNVSSQLLAVKGIIFSIGIILVNGVYNKYGDKIYQRYRSICVAEIGMYVALAVSMVYFGMSAPVYFMTETVSDIIIGRNIICCNSRIRRIVYNGEERETFDNSRPIAQSIAAVIGNLIAMIEIPASVCFILFSIGVIMGDVFLYIVHRKISADQQ